MEPRKPNWEGPFLELTWGIVPEQDGLPSAAAEKSKCPAAPSRPTKLAPGEELL